MQFKPNPAVHYRLHLLIKNSDKFKKEITKYSELLNDKLPPYVYRPWKEKVEYDQKVIDKKKIEVEEKRIEKAIEYAEKIEHEFLLSTNTEEKKLAVHIIEEMIRNGFQVERNVKLGVVFDEEKQQLQITIKAPLSQAELEEFWNEIAFVQRRFLLGTNPKTWEEHDQYLNSLNKAVLSVGRNLPETKIFKKLLAKKLEAPTSLTQIEKDNYYELQAFLYSKDIFKENPKKQLDDDLLILRLYQETGSVQQGEKAYRHKKLLHYLRQNEAVFNEADARLDFGLLTAKYFPKELTVPEIEKLAGIKNFEQRLQDIKESWLIL